MNSTFSSNVGSSSASQGTEFVERKIDDMKGNNSKDSDSEGEGAEEILEESPCKRWSKRREQVKQRDVPGIDCAYLAMDNETGNEVVWNEVLFSERKNFRSQEEQINAVFDKLTLLVHTNLVKFHKYWTDSKSDKPRIVFITEYMSSGSLARFLQRTRKSGATLNLKAWKKWTTQILAALSYLHSCNPPIVHGNLSCNTTFIQHNGLVKIGCVAPTAIQHHVKTFQENIRNMHYIAPEYEHCNAVAPPADIYSFGICALEASLISNMSLSMGQRKFSGKGCGRRLTCMALPTGLCGSSNGTETSVVSQDMIQRGLKSLEDPLQKDFIEKCLNSDPTKRPTARELLFHSILHEAYSLKLLAAHCIVLLKLNDSLSEDCLHVKDVNRVAATSKFRSMTYSQVPNFQVDLEKFLEDVNTGVYPLVTFPVSYHQGMTASTSSSAMAGEKQHDDRRLNGNKSESTPSADSPLEYKENRSIIKSTVTLNGSTITLIVQLDDMMNRQLTARITDSDTASVLASELVHHGLIAENDKARVEDAFAKALEKEPTDSSFGDERLGHEI
ncbi:unnamed protein product [Thelazia callipaeda]|uniref:Protein kinase domain-containing protein n=1 Tax=Thelazia callipaeda TaxID=103827 RepID=A0A0N5CM62_THECL|nr:unnamed protein product [Thelazia callipaeda]